MKLFKIIGTVLSIIAVIIAVSYFSVKEYKRTSVYPLAFSEISQIKKEQGTNLGAITEYYAMVNDVSMKIFEAYNISLERDVIGNGFAKELEIHVEPSFKIHKHNLPILLTNLPNVADKVLSKLTDLQNIQTHSKNVYDNISHAWDEDHDDVYRTEYYEVTETDSKGNTTSHTESRQVYDHTVHTYTFHKNYADASVEKLIEMLLHYEMINVPEEIRTASITQAEGEYATEKSFKPYVKKTDINFITNTILSWNKRTTYNIKLKIIIATYTEIKKIQNAYINSIKTSRSKRYITYSSTDDGPKEFQISKKMQNYVETVHQCCSQIISPIIEAKNNSVKLLNTINDYIAISLDRKKGNENNLKKSILETAEKWYNSNFAGGYNLHNFNIAYIIGISFLFIALAVAINILIWLKELQENS